MVALVLNACTSVCRDDGAWVVQILLTIRLCILAPVYAADINCTDENGSTPLHYAALANNLEAVQFLLKVRRCFPLFCAFV